MELKNFIEQGSAKAGSLTALGRTLGISQPDMSNAKAMKKPIPIDAAVKLADYIGADLRAVIAANELVTEKKEEKRAFWTPFAQHAKAASYAATLIIVTSFVTHSPADAAPLLASVTGILCIMLNRAFIWHLKEPQLHRPRFERFLKSVLTTNEPFFALGSA